MAFTKVLDLTESEIVECLRVVVAHHRTSAASTSNVNGMDVDPSPVATSSTFLPLSTMSSLVAAYPTSRGSLLVAFRRSIPDAAELTTILQLLNDWITQRMNMEKHLMPSKKDLKKTEQGVWVVVGRKHESKSSTSEVPPLEKVCSRFDTYMIITKAHHDCLDRQHHPSYPRHILPRTTTAHPCSQGAPEYPHSTQPRDYVRKCR